MPTFYTSISEDLGQWALSQPLFFAASAPLHSPSTHVNVSPKGLPAATLSILSPNLVAYLDSTGSGCETISHVYENGRVTLMFCSFGKSPRICRFFCRGKIVEWDDPAFEGWVERMEKKERMVEGVRAVIVLDVWKVQTSCGWGVPQMSIAPEDGEAGGQLKDRPTMNSFLTKWKAKGKLQEYQTQFNGKSLDGLPGLKVCRRDNGERLWAGDAKAWARRVDAQREGLFAGFVVGILMVMFVMLGKGMVGLRLPVIRL